MVKSAIYVVHICSSLGPTATAQRVLLEMSEAYPLIKKQLLCVRGSWLHEQMQARALPVFFFKRWFGKSLYLALQGLRLRPSIVHWYRIESLWLLLFFRLLGIKQVLTLTRKWTSQKGPGFTLGLWLVDRLVAANPSVERSFLRRPYGSFKRHAQIDPGIDLPPPGSPEPFGSKEAMAQRWGLKPGLFTVGVLVDGPQDKLEAFFDVAASFKESAMQWVLVTMRRPGWTIRLKAKRFPNLHLFEKEKAWRPLLKAMDVLYVPRDQPDEMPFAGLEALALGVRLLSTAEGDEERLLFSGVTGYQLKRDHPEDLLRGLVYLLETPCINKNRLMRDFLINRYSKRAMIEKLSLVYQEVLGAQV